MRLRFILVVIAVVLLGAAPSFASIIQLTPSDPEYAGLDWIDITGLQFVDLFGTMTPLHDSISDGIATLQFTPSVFVIEGLEGFLFPYNPAFNIQEPWGGNPPENWPAGSSITINLPTPVGSLAFDAYPDRALAGCVPSPTVQCGTLTATFYTTTSETLTFSLDGNSDSIYTFGAIAGGGALINKVDVSLVGGPTADNPDILLGWFAYEEGDVAVPEPASFALIGAGLLGVAALSRRMRRAA